MDDKYMVIRQEKPIEFHGDWTLLDLVQVSEAMQRMVTEMLTRTVIHKEEQEDGTVLQP